MAQFGTLSIGTLQIAPQAVTGSATGDKDNPVIALNPADKPVTLSGYARAAYVSNSSSMSGELVITLKRTRGNVTISTDTLTWSGNTLGAQSFKAVGIGGPDLDAQADDEYSIVLTPSVSGSPGSASVTVTASSIAVLWEKV